MPTHTDQTAPTQFVEAKRIRFAYRRFGKAFNSYILQQNIPNAQLILYPDANHGSQYQYPERFVRHVSMFLSEVQS